jgi:hypothetical protein
MSERDELEVASIIRRAAQIRPFGPNSIAVHAEGGSVMLTPAEAEAAARAVLASPWLAAHDERVRAEALRPVLALADEWERQGATVDSAARVTGGRYAAALRAALLPTPDAGAGDETEAGEK